MFAIGPKRTNHFSGIDGAGTLFAGRGANMRQREFLSLAAGAIAVWSPVQAQQGDRVRRIRVAADDDSAVQARVAAFRQSLQQLGWIDGRNLHIEYRWGEGKAADTRKYAAELVGVPARVLRRVAEAAQ